MEQNIALMVGLTNCSEEIASLTLHQCGNDLDNAINMFYETDSLTAQKVSNKKSSKKSIGQNTKKSTSDESSTKNEPLKTEKNNIGKDLNKNLVKNPKTSEVPKDDTYLPDETTVKNALDSQNGKLANKSAPRKNFNTKFFDKQQYPQAPMSNNTNKRFPKQSKSFSNFNSTKKNSESACLESENNWSGQSLVVTNSSSGPNFVEELLNTDEEKMSSILEMVGIKSNISESCPVPVLQENNPPKIDIFHDTETLRREIFNTTQKPKPLPPVVARFPSKSVDVLCQKLDHGSGFRFGDEDLLETFRKTQIMCASDKFHGNQSGCDNKLSNQPVASQPVSVEKITDNVQDTTQKPHGNISVQGLLNQQPVQQTSVSNNHQFVKQQRHDGPVYESEINNQFAAVVSSAHNSVSIPITVSPNYQNPVLGSNHFQIINQHMAAAAAADDNFARQQRGTGTQYLPNAIIQLLQSPEVIQQIQQLLTTQPHLLQNLNPTVGQVRTDNSIENPHSASFHLSTQAPNYPAETAYMMRTPHSIYQTAAAAPNSTYFVPTNMIHSNEQLSTRVFNAAPNHLVTDSNQNTVKNPVEAHILEPGNFMPKPMPHLENICGQNNFPTQRSYFAPHNFGSAPPPPSTTHISHQNFVAKNNVQNNSALRGNEQHSNYYNKMGYIAPNKDNIYWSVPGAQHNPIQENNVTR